MIIREEIEKFIFTRQHHHAHISGEIARHFEHFFIDDPRFVDALFAIHEHDRSWIVPDAVPKWNLRKERPYDFIDFSLEEKLKYYRLGLNETEEMNPYAGLLCSMHYTSFIHFDDADKLSQDFLRSEWKRQEELRKKLVIIQEDLLHKHFQLLQLCDKISLYLCLNSPRVDKSDEHYFFKDGFKNSSSFNPTQRKDLMAKWSDKSEVNIIPFPFNAPFEVSIRQRHLSKETIAKIGLESAFLQCEIKTLRLRFSRV